MSDQEFDPPPEAHGNVWRWTPNFGQDDTVEYGFECDDEVGFGSFWDDALGVVKTVASAPVKTVVAAAKPAGGILGNAVKVAGREIGHVTAPIQKVGGAVAKTFSKIPVVGAPVNTAMTAAYHAVTAPANMAVNIASGKRIDKVVMGQLKTAVQDVKGLAPYAQTVMSFVPGVGSGASAAIGAGMALADGQPIDKAMIAAVTSAVPGGPVAQAAAKAAVAGVDAAIHGEKYSVHSATDPFLDTLPIPPAAKEALKTGTRMTADIAAGKKVDAAIADAALQEGMKYLDANSKKAFQSGLAVATGAVMQQVKHQALPEIHGKLAESGIQLAKTLPVVGEARKLAGHGVKGFDIAHGLLTHKASLFDVVSTRSRMPTPHDKMGFDMAIASRIGLVTRPHSREALSDAAKAGRAITYGMQGIKQPQHKVAIMKQLEASPSAAVGAKVAVKHVTIEREPFPVRLIKTLTSGIKALFH